VYQNRTLTQAAYRLHCTLLTVGCVAIKLGRQEARSQAGNTFNHFRFQVATSPRSFYYYLFSLLS